MIKMNEELKITNEDIELLKEMKENCLKADVYDDEKRLLKANAITKFLILQNNWNELNKFIEEEKNRLATQVGNIYEDSLDKIHFVNEDIFNELTKVSNKMQELEQGKDE